MSNFTPGPYCDNGDGFIRQAEQNEGHRLYIAQVIEIPFNFGGDETTEANINLLRSAPEMYEALVELQWSDHGWCPQCANGPSQGHQTKCVLGVALAKANGKPNPAPPANLPA